jgi:hypothetical protein
MVDTVWRHRRIGAIGAFHSISGETGTTFDLHDYGDEALLLIVTGLRYGNLGAAQTLADWFEATIARGYTGLIAVDGAFGDVDVSWLRDIDDQYKETALKSLFNSGKLTAAEYVAARSELPFVLFGADDQDLHRQAMQLWAKQAPLWKYIEEARPNAKVLQSEIEQNPKLRKLYPLFLKFDELDRRRAAKILENVLAKMKILDIPQALITCTGNLPKYVGERADEACVSHVDIGLADASTGDAKAYEKRLLEDLHQEDPDRG